MIKKNTSFRMVLVDLDGTLLNNQKLIGDLDYKTLEMLGRNDVARVIATGRNLQSVLGVLQEITPFDYLVFSSGAGILDWKSRKILFQSEIDRHTVTKVEKILKSMQLNYAIHYPLPENHKYFFYKGNYQSSDFDNRNSIYKNSSYELKNGYPFDFATQFLVILNHESEFQYVASKIKGLKVIRATSPIDGLSVWLEIFNPDVSKAMGGNYLCSRLNIPRELTVGIGNDYNDIDLLNWTAYSYMVENGPENLKKMYLPCNSNQNNPLTMVINQLID